MEKKDLDLILSNFWFHWFIHSFWVHFWRLRSMITINLMDLSIGIMDSFLFVPFIFFSWNTGEWSDLVYSSYLLIPESIKVKACYTAQNRVKQSRHNSNVFYVFSCKIKSRNWKRALDWVKLNEFFVISVNQHVKN